MSERAADNQRIEKVLQYAWSLLSSGEYDKALWQYDYILRLAPDNQEAARLITVAGGLACVQESLRQPGYPGLAAHFRDLQDTVRDIPGVRRADWFQALEKRCFQALGSAAASASPADVPAATLSIAAAAEPEPIEDRPRQKGKLLLGLDTARRRLARILDAPVLQRWAKMRASLQATRLGKLLETRPDLISFLFLAAMLLAREILCVYILVNYYPFPNTSTLGLDRALMARAWAQAPSFNLDFGAWPAPIMWLDGLWLKLWFDPLTAIPVLDSLFWAGTIVLLYLIARRISGTRLFSLVCAAFWAFQPATIWLSMSIQGENKCIFFVMLGILGYLRYQDSGRNRWLALTALCFMAATSGRLDFGSFSVVLASLLLWQMFRRKKVNWSALGLGGVSFAFIAAYLAYWWWYAGDPFSAVNGIKGFFLASAWVQRVIPTTWDKVLLFPKMAFQAWPVILVLALPGLAAMVWQKKMRTAAVPLALFAIVPFLAIAAATGMGQGTTGFGPGPRHVMGYAILMTIPALYLLYRLASKWQAHVPMLAILAVVILWSLPGNIQTSLYPPTNSQRSSAVLGHSLDSLFDRGYLSGDRKILVEQRAGTNPAYIPNDFGWDFIPLLVAHNTLAYPSWRWGRPQLAEPPSDLTADELKAHNVKVAIAASKEGIGKLSGFMTPVGSLLHYQVFVFPEDVQLGRELVSAISALPAWSAAYALGTRLLPEDNALEMTTPRLDNTLTYSNGTSGGVENQAFYTKALPAGDFVTEVDFECLSLPRPTGQNRNELFLRATVNGVGFRVARWEANSGGSYFFQRYPGGKIYTASTKDTSGRLRLRRVSDTVFGEFWRDGGWVKVSSADGASGPAYIDLGLLSTGGDQLDVKFSNFTLKATTVSFDLSPDDWSAENLSQSPVYDAGGVTLKKTGPAGNQWIVSAFPLGSDNFTVSVDYEAKQFPAPADKGTRNDILFSAELGNQQYTLAYVTDKYGQHYRYQAWPANPTAFVPAPGTPSGRLRLRRDKNKLWAETWNNGTWATLGSIDIPAKVPAYIRLGTFSDTGQRLEVRFSNLQVE